LHNNIFIFEESVSLDYPKWPTIVTIDKSPKFKLSTLREHLPGFFSQNNFGIVITSGYGRAIMKSDDQFFLFDSHGLDCFGNQSFKGSGGIVGFNSIPSLADHLEAMIRSTSTISKLQDVICDSFHVCRSTKSHHKVKKKKNI
jgi:hypothetical protein